MDGKNMFAKAAAERAEQQREIEAKVTGRKKPAERDKPAGDGKKADRRKPNPNDAATILITLSARQKERLKVEAAKYGTSASALVREWIDQL